ncbi:hypothetical protein TNCV_220501 [Trichonephila clavipes]|nr:hypothetical protein TNCV_220501 [Trichonephila clavipes]
MPAHMPFCQLFYGSWQPSGQGHYLVSDMNGLDPSTAEYPPCRGGSNKLIRLLMWNLEEEVPAQLSYS